MDKGKNSIPAPIASNEKYQEKKNVYTDNGKTTLSSQGTSDKSCKKDEGKKKVLPKHLLYQCILRMQQKNGGQKRMRVVTPGSALALRPRDNDGNIVLGLVAKYQDKITANRPGVWTKTVSQAAQRCIEGPTLTPQQVDIKQALPDELLIQVFHDLVDIWKNDHGPHFKTVAHGRLLSLWKGCKIDCCPLPDGLFVNRLARDASMDRMLFAAERSDGFNHIILPVFAKALIGIAIKDFGRGKIGEPFYRPVFNEKGHDITKRIVEEERAQEAAVEKAVDDGAAAEKTDTIDVDDKDVDVNMDNLKL